MLRRNLITDRTGIQLCSSGFLHVSSPAIVHSFTILQYKTLYQLISIVTQDRLPLVIVNSLFIKVLCSLHTKLYNHNHTTAENTELQSGLPFLEVTHTKPLNLQYIYFHWQTFVHENIVCRTPMGAVTSSSKPYFLIWIGSSQYHWERSLVAIQWTKLRKATAFSLIP